MCLLTEMLEIACSMVKFELMYAICVQSMAVNVLVHHGGLLTEFGVAVDNFMLMQGFHYALYSSHLPFKSLLSPQVCCTITDYLHRSLSQDDVVSKFVVSKFANTPFNAKLLSYQLI